MRGKKEANAYMTVEISLLFPLVVIILMCIIYMTFYSYNRAIAFQNAAITALYGQNGFFLEDEKQHERMYTVLENLNEGQYIAIDKLRQKVSIEKNRYVVKQGGNVNIPLLSSEIMSELGFKESIKVKKYEAVFYIRQIRRVKADEV